MPKSFGATPLQLPCAKSPSYLRPIGDAINQFQGSRAATCRFSPEIRWFSVRPWVGAGHYNRHNRTPLAQNLFAGWLAADPLVRSRPSFVDNGKRHLVAAEQHLAQPPALLEQQQGLVVVLPLDSL